jgi:CHASE3 domain sensor protein
MRRKNGQRGHLLTKNDRLVCIFALPESKISIRAKVSVK